MSDEAKATELEANPPAAEVAEAHEPTPSETTEFPSPELLALLRKAVPVAWLVAAVVAGFVWGVQMVILVLAAGAVTFVIVLMWSSVQSLTGGNALGFEEALGMGAPSKVEEEKRAVLRALKDLEYERGVGKISQEDYAELLAKYRAEAKRLIQSVDEALGPARAEVEKALSKRLSRAGLNPVPAPASSTEAKAPQPAASGETEVKSEQTAPEPDADQQTSSSEDDSATKEKP